MHTVDLPGVLPAAMAILRTVPLRETPELLRHLDDILQPSGGRNGTFGIGGHHIPIATLLGTESNTTAVQGDGLRSLQTHLSRSIPEIIMLFIAYCLIFCVSLVANSLVCCVVLRNKRMRTITNTFIANLALSDLAITVTNVPITLLRFVYKDWILGHVTCILTNSSLMVSIYVSTFTMMAIALDRYMVILYPLRPRLSVKGGLIVIAVSWVIAILLSLPFAIFAQVETVDLILSSTKRCRIHYPEPSDVYERYVTLVTFLVQYVLPMLLTAVSYGQIVHKVWSREVVGQHTGNQQLSHQKTRKRTIKLLIVVVAVFSVCWLPINLYHVLTDFHPDNETFYYNSTVYLCLHWLAISSCCYNPFIYCWLNGSFRKELKARLTHCCEHREPVVMYPRPEVDEPLAQREIALAYKSLHHHTTSRKGSASHSSSTKSSTRGSKASILRRLMRQARFRKEAHMDIPEGREFQCRNNYIAKGACARAKEATAQV